MYYDTVIPLTSIALMVWFDYGVSMVLVGALVSIVFGPSLALCLIFARGELQLQYARSAATTTAVTGKAKND